MNSLVRFTPVSGLHTMQHEIDRLFHNFFPARSLGNICTDTACCSPNGDAVNWSPRVDIAESEQEYVLHADAPGMTKDAFDIHWQENVLTVSGEREIPAPGENEKSVRADRVRGTFGFSYRLPKATTDGGRIAASYEAGVLTIRIPKEEAARPHRIAVS